MERCSDWPGLTCLPQLLGPSKRTFRWFNWTKRWSQGQGGGEEGRFAQEWAEPVELEVAPLPCWADLSEATRHRAANTSSPPWKLARVVVVAPMPLT